MQLFSKIFHLPLPISVTIFPLSESAVTLQYGEEIRVALHRELLLLQEKIRNLPFEGFTEVSIAFNTLTVFFDPVRVYEASSRLPLDFVTQWLKGMATSLGDPPPLHEKQTTGLPQSREHLIPVCYDMPYAFDLETIAAFHGSDTETIIRLHTSQVFYVFMVGFTPGFPYMGILPPALDTPRKATPAIRVPAGSVGIAGQQTGIYPFHSPGGWNIIGRTPIRLFNVQDPEPCLFKAGDRVRFSRIDAYTFNYLNQYEDH